MKQFKITWKTKDKYKEQTRTNMITAQTKEDAMALCHQAFGNTKKIEILSAEVADTDDA